MFQGLRTVIYGVNDLDTARTWFTGLLGKEPYFDEPFYVGFDVGGYELGLLPGTDADFPTAGQSYWGVPNCTAAWQTLLDGGATNVDAPTDVGGDIVTAVVRSPEGHRIGIIENPNSQFPAASSQ